MTSNFSFPVGIYEQLTYILFMAALLAINFRLIYEQCSCIMRRQIMAEQTFFTSSQLADKIHYVDQIPKVTLIGVLSDPPVIYNRLIFR